MYPPNPENHFVNFSYRFAARDPQHDVYPAKSRTCGGLPWEGFEKAAWLHHTTGTPVTWIVDTVALQQAGDRLRQFAESYGDDIILCLEALGHQPYYEKIGIRQNRFGLRNYSHEELVSLISRARELARETLRQDVTIGAGFWLSGPVMAAARDAGLDAWWGLCWDQYGIDGATHRGSPWFPYYASTADFRTPVLNREDGILILPWYRADLGNVFFHGYHPPFTTHSGELARWNTSYPSSYMQSLLRQGLDETQRSPFALTEIHLECDWIDSSGIFYDEQSSPATEVWAFQKACVQEGISPDIGHVQNLHDFVRWHHKNHPQTSRHELLWRDPLGQLPDLLFAADADSLSVSSTTDNAPSSGLARQTYLAGCLDQATPSFDDRSLFRKNVHPTARLPTALARHLSMNVGREAPIS